MSSFQRTGTVSTSNDEVEWSIPDFLNILKRASKYFLCSPKFEFSGGTWYLQVHNAMEYSEKIYFYLNGDTSSRTNIAEFFFSLKTVNGQKDLKIPTTLINTVIFSASIWMSELSMRRSELLSSGVLKVVFTPKRAWGSFSRVDWAEKGHRENSGVAASTQTDVENGDASALRSSIRNHDGKLQRDLKELFLKKEDCDVIIKVKGREFPVHKNILKARSPVFASNFRHNMKENATGVVKIKDCDPSSFSDFLCFLYCGDVTVISRENVFGLFTAADKYEVLDLRAKCLVFMGDNLSVDTFCDTITVALRHSETELIHSATDYFTKNAPKIIETVEWQNFLADNPTESNELFRKFANSVKPSNA